MPRHACRDTQPRLVPLHAWKSFISFVLPQVCSFDHDVPAGTVLEALSALKILSAPVMVRPDHVEGPGRVHYSSREVPLKGLMGFVGVSDILEGLLKGEEAARVQCAEQAIRLLGLRSWPSLLHAILLQQAATSNTIHAYCSTEKVMSCTTTATTRHDCLHRHLPRHQPQASLRARRH